MARNARQPCWKADSTAIAYLKGEVEQFTYTDYATKGVFIYDLATRQHTQHPNKELYHLYNLCWSPDGKWFVATVHAGMGYRHAILAIRSRRDGGPRPGDPRLPAGYQPRRQADRLGAERLGAARRRPGLLRQKCRGCVNARDVVTSEKPMKIYHVDWSPDGKYIAFSRGPATRDPGTDPGNRRRQGSGLEIGVADVTQTESFDADHVRRQLQQGTRLDPAARKETP